MEGSKDACRGSGVGAIVLGASLGFSSPTMAAVYNASQGDEGRGCVDWQGHEISENAKMLNCELALSDSMSSWFGSLINIGALLGAMVSSSLLDRFGKRAGMLLLHSLYVVGWGLCAGAPGHAATSLARAVDRGQVVIMLVLSRLFIGIAVGIACASIPNYQVELAPTNLRGAVGSLFQISVVLGLFFVYLAGCFLDWRSMAVALVVLSAGGLLLLLFLPETPTWLARKGRLREARAVLERARGGGAYDFELNGPREEQGVDAGGILSKRCRKPLLIAVGLMFVQQWSGINAVMFFCGSILQSVFSDSAEANEYSIGIQALQVLVTLVAARFMDSVGRRPLLLVAALGLSLSSLSLSLFYLVGQQCDSQGCSQVIPKPVAVASLYAYILFFSCGMGAIPWFILGEISPPHAQASISAIATSVNWILSFSITKSLEPLTELLGGAGEGLGKVFLFYSCVCLLGACFIHAFVPETKGKSFEEIQAMLHGESAEKQDLKTAA
ncbi:hypothetical protein GUITHDRAFT_143612 [Guillardia theta CCMP2712]|uniref:Major facilitator superfamily (MFS) profile domain-containing protein n=1 Tax=Guillardia theta (strain CCMP2712) TaxID=905079 RepID=L1ITN9_GUITC|nr:hypothetical protein GUITHDRAFT_143612 [Guillardia theta CCMP2712]EKX39200.1 hypothetical protein GUITHDRAFT_143612 [Guillardia theta CCMP2712]|eukprot:XP_005826180.1 hypothetical protein GUITHDRAFT_143612 [Guillardia theta CCMP2712]